MVGADHTPGGGGAGTETGAVVRELGSCVGCNFVGCARTGSQFATAAAAGGEKGEKNLLADRGSGTLIARDETTSGNFGGTAAVVGMYSARYWV